MKLLPILACSILLPLVSSCGGGSSEAAGTYELDITVMKEMAEKEIATMSAEEQGMARMALGMFDSMSASIVLADDGTFTATFNTPMGNNEAKGTWTLDGDQLTMKNTHEDGKKLENGETQTVTYKDGELTMQSTEDASPPMLFKRK